jgi:hypothetical protein
MNWSPDDVRSDVLNRILWLDAKGYDVPYPVRNDEEKAAGLRQKQP